MLKLGFFRERNIVERIRKNDRAVLGELFVRYEKMIGNYIVTHGGSDADAEDILQEAIIVLWQKANNDDFQLTSKVSTFLMAIARNKWMAEMRKRKRWVNQDPDLNLADDNDSLLDGLIADERIASVREALDSMNEVCKKVLIMFYFEERSLDSIAKDLGFSNAGVAKSKKYQCKKAFEERLKKVFNEVERGT